MGNVCCQTDIDKSALQADIPKAIQFENSTLPENDHILKEWLAQNNIQIQYHDPTLPESADKPKAMKHKDRNRYYYGNWKDGVPQGNGLIYEPQKILFNGHFHNGLPEGNATIKFIQEGCDFEGQLKNGRAHGQGTIDNLRQKYRFKGIWQDSKPNKGILTLISDPNISTIEFQDFEKGKGIIYYQDNRRYQGYINTTRLVPNGKGKVIFPTNSNKVSYEGDFLDGVMHGKGKFIWNDDSKYEGDYINGKKQGQGKFTFPQGNYYDGFWLNGKQGGVGTLYNKNGEQLKCGKWVDGIFQSPLDKSQFKTQSKILEDKIQSARKQAEDQIHRHSEQQAKKSLFHNQSQIANSKKQGFEYEKHTSPHFQKQEFHQQNEGSKHFSFNNKKPNQW